MSQRKEKPRLACATFKASVVRIQAGNLYFLLSYSAHNVTGYATLKG